MINCLCFGDSITYGEYDGVSGGWTEILKRYFHSRFINENIEELNVFNLGIGGETTDGIVKDSVQKLLHVHLRIKILFSLLTALTMLP